MPSIKVRIVRKWAVSFALAMFATLMPPNFAPGIAAPTEISVAAGSCPMGIYANAYGISDGCRGAPIGTPNNVTLFQNPQYFGAGGYALQSGQSYKTRPPWNVAGADYPVGIPGNIKLKDPYAEFLAGRFPAGCTVNPKGNSVGGGIIQCSAKDNLTIDGYDMSGSVTGSGVCYVIGIKAPAGGSYTLNYRNNLHKRLDGCIGRSHSGFAIQIFPGAWSHANFTNNVWDYSPRATGPGSGYMPISLGGNSFQAISFRYNVFKNIPQNLINGNPTNFGLELAYNYIDSYVFDVSNQNHAEVTNLNGGGVRTQYYFHFNNILRGNNPGRGSGTALIWLSAATPNGAVFKDGQIFNNVAIANCDTTLPPSRGQNCRSNAGAAMSEANSMSLVSNQWDRLKISWNYTDYTGALAIGRFSGVYCATPVEFTENRDLVSGGILTSWSDPGVTGIQGYIEGATLTILAKRPIWPGAAITGPGVAAGTQVTGPGFGTQPGNYTVNIPQTVGSISSPVALSQPSGCTR